MTELPVQFARHIAAVRAAIELDDPRDIAVMPKNVASQMQALTTNAAPTPEQQGWMLEAMREVEQAATELAQVLLQPAVLDDEHGEKVETAQSNMRKKVAHLERLMANVELSQRASHLG